MSSRIKAVIAGSAVIVTLSACSSGISAGTVVDQEYVPGYFSQTCIPSGKTTVCYPVYNPPIYYLSLRNDRGETGTVYLDQGDWESYEIGDYYP